MRPLLHLFLSIVAVSLLAACGASGTPVSVTVQESGSTRLVTHRFGVSPAPLNPQKVVALGEEELLADLLDAQVRVVASNANVTESFPGFQAEELEGITIFVSTQANLETIAALQPDLIIGYTIFIDGIGYDKLSAIAPTVAIDSGFDWQQAYRELLSVFGKTELAQSNLDAYTARVAEAKTQLNAQGRPISVGTIYPGPSPAAWVDGPTSVPQLLLDLGFTLSPTPEAVKDLGVRNGRAFFSLERLDLFAADTLILVQSTLVEGEAQALLDAKASPLWAQLPAVQQNRVFELNRFGYPGLRGRNALLTELVALLTP